MFTWSWGHPAQLLQMAPWLLSYPLFQDREKGIKCNPRLLIAFRSQYAATSEGHGKNNSGFLIKSCVGAVVWQQRYCYCNEFWALSARTRWPMWLPVANCDRHPFDDYPGRHPRPSYVYWRVCILMKYNLIKFLRDCLINTGFSACWFG